MPSLGSQALAHVAWGLCCCDAQPPAFWMDELCAAARVSGGGGVERQGGGKYCGGIAVTLTAFRPHTWQVTV